MIDWLDLTGERQGDPVAPDVIALDPRFGPLSNLVLRLSDMPVEKLLVYLIDQVDARFLPELGSQFHLTGLEGWNLADTDEKRRSIIKRSIAMHRKKGTPWSIYEALKQTGVAVELVERADQRRLFARALPNYLDSTWNLDGSVRLREVDRRVYFYPISHWATFLARMNLDEVRAAGALVLALIKALIVEWKPMSRHPIWLLWLESLAVVLINASYALVAHLASTRLHPWDNKSLSCYRDAKWRMGRDGAVTRLGLDGTTDHPLGFLLGRRYGALPGYRLRHGRVGHAVRARLSSRASVWRLERLALEPLAPLLFWRGKRVDGSWQVREGVFLRCPPPGCCLVLDGSWSLAYSRARLRLSGIWRVGGPRFPEFSVLRRLS